MTNNEFFRHLDDPSIVPDDPHDRDLACLLAEVGEMECPDPGALYWQRFNARLNEKLASRRQSQRKVRWARWAFYGTLAAAAALVLMVWSPLRQTTQVPSLEELSDDGLAMLSETFYVEDEHVAEPIEFEATEMDVLLQAYDVPYESLLFDMEGDIQESLELLKSDWNLEG